MSTVDVRRMVDDAAAAVALEDPRRLPRLTRAGGAFADVARGDPRLLPSGAASAAGRPMPDGRSRGPAPRAGSRDVGELFQPARQGVARARGS